MRIRSSVIEFGTIFVCILVPCLSSQTGKTFRNCESYKSVEKFVLNI